MTFCYESLYLLVGSYKTDIPAWQGLPCVFVLSGLYSCVLAGGYHRNPFYIAPLASHVNSMASELIYLIFWLACTGFAAFQFFSHLPALGYSPVH